jgi:type IV pilus assembly protein PilA
MNIRGYSILEILAVIVIIGVLSTIALPYYNQYTIRARVAEGLNLVSAAQIAVSDFVSNSNSLPVTQVDTRYISPPSTANVTSIVIGPKGVVTVNFSPAAGAGSILFVPSVQTNNGLAWDCTAGTLASQYRPTVCRP